MNNDVSHVAQDLFAKPFFTERTLRPDLKREGPVKLALALMQTGVTYGQLNALALAVRAVGELEEQSAEVALSKKQQASWDKLVLEKAVPAPFRAVLKAASPRLAKRRDLYALYGVLAGTMERLTSIGNVGELVMQPAPPKAIKTKRPKSAMRG